MHILFDDRSTILAVNVEGTRLRTVVDANPGERFTYGLHADISPDGSRIVYSSCQYQTVEVEPEDLLYPLAERETYTYQIGTVALDGSSPQLLTRKPVHEDLPFNHYPAWSPDMTKIAFHAAAWSGELATRSQVRIMSADGSNVSGWIGPRGLLVDSPPVWSPDGQWLAFAGVFGYDLYMVRTDGPGVHHISRLRSMAAWSPDSQRLALARREGEETVLITVATDGSDPQIVTEIDHDGYVSPVAWSPDGRHILYRCAAGVCVVDLDGNLIGQSPPGWIGTEDIEEGRYVGANHTPRAAWSPDSARIAIRPYGYPRPLGSAVVFTMAHDGTEARALVRDGRSTVPANSGYQDVRLGVVSCWRGFVVPNPEQNIGLARDCQTLMRLRDSLVGSTVINWNPGTPVEGWEGVSLSGHPSRVTGLDFPRWDLYGTGYMEGHYLSGTVPRELASLSTLRTLAIGGNDLTGNIPPQLGNLANLEVLDLRDNTLSGRIPPELGNLANLEVLDLRGNNLSGPIPPELGNLANLEVLDLRGNNLSGPIPPELAGMVELRELRLGGYYYDENRFTGCIAPELPEIWVEASWLERCPG